LVQDGCGNTPIFPVTFHSSVKDLDENPPIVLGEFSAVDNTSLQPPGFWTFFYVIRATAEDGGVSDFKFYGTVSVSCANLGSFS
jgi:hypothetical protein